MDSTLGYIWEEVTMAVMTSIYLSFTKFYFEEKLGFLEKKIVLVKLVLRAACMHIFNSSFAFFFLWESFKYKGYFVQFFQNFQTSFKFENLSHNERDTG